MAPPEMGLTHIAVRAGAGNNPQTRVFGCVEEPLDVLTRSLKVKDTLARRVVRPEEVEAAPSQSR